MEKLNKQILIGLADDDQCAVSISPDMDAATALQLIGTLSLHVLNAFKSVAEYEINNNPDTTVKQKQKEAAITGITESLYDAMDNIFSTVLNQFYPAHPKYSIEDEAILELTNQKIQAKYDALTPEQKSSYHQAYNKMKLQAEFRKATQSKKPDSNLKSDNGTINTTTTKKD